MSAAERVPVEQQLPGSEATRRTAENSRNAMAPAETAGLNPDRIRSFTVVEKTDFAESRDRKGRLNRVARGRFEAWQNGCKQDRSERTPRDDLVQELHRQAPARVGGTGD